jgi:precorrin-6B methylase 2
MDALARLAAVEATENFGGEYPSLRWYCTWRRADEGARARMRSESREAARFLDVFGDDATMRQYVAYKYRLPGAAPGPRLHWLDELLRFNSPVRTEWERTVELEGLLGVREGMAVADVGAGSGFFSFRFAETVGRAGRVYAVELDPDHLAYLRRVKDGEGLDQLVVIEGTGSSTGLEAASVDLLFLCSTYQAIYGMLREGERSAWIASATAALRPGGRLVVADNAPDGEVGGAPPYRGISISKRLVTTQLEAYGFRLVADRQFIPQRYVLVFERAG